MKTTEAKADYWDILHAMAAKLTTRGLNVTVEGGGAAIGFLALRLHNGETVHIGDCAETWGGQIYLTAEDAENGDYTGDGIELGIPTSVELTVSQVDAWSEALVIVLLATMPHALKAARNAVTR
jgi:hypothetical protein